MHNLHILLSNTDITNIILLFILITNNFEIDRMFVRAI